MLIRIQLADKVIVNDEPILDTLEKLWLTSKELCSPLQEDIDKFLQFDAGPSGKLDKIIHEKINKQDPCCLLDYHSKVSEISGKDFFMLHGKAFMNFLKIFNPFVRKDIFISDRTFLSPLIVSYLAKSIDKRAKAEFNRQAYIYLEAGFKFKSFRTVDLLIDKQFPPVKNTFHSIREYVKHYTMISDVTMNDFTFVYAFYIFWALILIIFILHCNIRRIRRLLRNCYWALNRLIGSMRLALNKIRLHRGWLKSSQLLLLKFTDTLSMFSLIHTCMQDYIWFLINCMAWRRWISEIERL